MSFKNKSAVIGKSTPVALATVLTALLMNGCIWDSGLYEDFAVNDGDLVRCPPKVFVNDKGILINSNNNYVDVYGNETDKKFKIKDGYLLDGDGGDSSYVDKKGNPVDKNNKVLIKSKYLTYDSSKMKDYLDALKYIDDGQNIYNSDSSDYKKSFEYNLCPSAYSKCDFNSNLNGDKEIGFYCSSDNIGCNTVADCEKRSGWAEGACVEGECVASSCAKGYELKNGKCEALECPDNKHVYDGSCEPDSIENCGKHGNNCTQKVSGWVSGKCIGGECVADACDEVNGYQLSDGKCESGCKDGEHLYQKICESNSMENCGSHVNDCKKIPGWINGDCINGECIASECNDEGYKLKDGKCEALIECPDNHHFYSGKCEEDSLENCGSHGNDCTSLGGWDTGECRDGKCYAENCKDYNNQSYENVDGKCTVITGCDGDKNKYYDEGVCKDNSMYNCGVKDNDCTLLAGWNSGDCIEGQCSAESCTEYNGQSYELKKQQNGDAEIGVCTVITGCGGDKNKYYDNGVCKDNDLSNCGIKGNDCTSLAGWKEGDCVEGQCSAKSCTEFEGQSYDLKKHMDGELEIGICVVITGCGGDNNKYYDNGVCKDNNVDNCGIKDYSCASLPGWATGACVDGKCLASECKEYGGQSYEVKSGVCTVITGCKGDKNKYYDNGVCKDNNVDNCGIKDYSCSSLSGWKTGNCTEGKCIAETCKEYNGQSYEFQL